MTSKPYKPRKDAYGGKWASVRRRILKRDNYQCQIGLPNCTLTATSVDHITPLAWGGELYDESNLRAACRNCNLKLGAVAKKHKPKPPAQTNKPPADPPGTASRRW